MDGIGVGRLKMLRWEFPREKANPALLAEAYLVVKIL
jgi:hypothetical protein